MTRIHSFILASVLSLAVSPAFAQSANEPGGIVFVNGGGFTALTDLNDAGTADFKTGFNAGGGLGFQFNKFVALRGQFTFARSEGRDTSAASGINGTQFNRFFYGADIQLRAPLANGVTPYVFGGGGAVSIQPDTTPSQDSFTKGAGRFGAGLSFAIPRSNAAVYLEGTTWIYPFDRYGFDKVQADLTWSGGVSYRFGK